MARTPISDTRFEDLLDTWEPKLRDAFLAAIHQIRIQARIDAIVRMLENGDIEGAIIAVGLDPADFRTVEKTFFEGFEAAALLLALTIPFVKIADGVHVPFKFNINDLVIVRFLKEHTTKFADRILTDQRDMLRAAFTQAQAKGQSARKTAQDILGTLKNGRRESGLVGLTSTQAEWSRAYADELASSDPAILAKALDRKSRDPRFDPSIKRALKAEQAIPGPLKANMVGAYRNRLLRQRAESIGLLESGTALHEGQRQAMAQAIGRNAVDVKDIILEWRSKRDKRVRNSDVASHVYLDGSTVMWGGTFIGISGARLRYPKDPQAPIEETINCRCRLITGLK